jgi:hypothetical protein
MQGTIIWWSQAKSHGVISVTQNGQNQRFFLLLSRIASAPGEIRAGQFANFTATCKPAREGLLPLALGVAISDKPFEGGAE